MADVVERYTAQLLTLQGREAHRNNYFSSANKKYKFTVHMPKHQDRHQGKQNKI